VIDEGNKNVFYMLTFKVACSNFKWKMYLINHGSKDSYALEKKREAIVRWGTFKRWSLVGGS
jgi:hypothetical protein